MQASRGGGARSCSGRTGSEARFHRAVFWPTRVDGGNRETPTPLLIGAFERPVEATQDRTLSEEARHRLAAHATEMDGLMGAPEYRSTLREHTKGPLPAVEAISDEVAERLTKLAA